MNKLPDHKCSLTIVHNDHKNIYQSAEEWIEENTFYQWISEEEKKKAIENDSIWTIQVYPETPIGFYAYAASNLETLLEYLAHDQ